MLNHFVIGFLATFTATSPFLVPPPANVITGNASISGTLTVDTVASSGSNDLTLSPQGTDVKINTGKRWVMDDNNDENDYITCTANDNCRLVVGGAVPITALSNAITINGSFVSTGDNLGWAVVDGTDNTACTSQCTSAAVFGFNLAAGATAPVLVGPSDAAADICLCAGSS